MGGGWQVREFSQLQVIPALPNVAGKNLYI
jgi:hypothetical protein